MKTIEELEEDIRRLIIRFDIPKSYPNWFTLEVKSKYKNKKVRVIINGKIYYGEGSTYNDAFEELISVLRTLLPKEEGIPSKG